MVAQTVPAPVATSAVPAAKAKRAPKASAPKLAAVPPAKVAKAPKVERESREDRERIEREAALIGVPALGPAVVSSHKRLEGATDALVLLAHGAKVGAADRSTRRAVRDVAALA